MPFGRGPSCPLPKQKSSNGLSELMLLASVPAPCPFKRAALPPGTLCPCAPLTKLYLQYLKPHVVSSKDRQSVWTQNSGSTALLAPHPVCSPCFTYSDFWNWFNKPCDLGILTWAANHSALRSLWDSLPGNISRPLNNRGYRCQPVYRKPAYNCSRASVSVDAINHRLCSTVTLIIERIRVIQPVLFKGQLYLTATPSSWFPIFMVPCTLPCPLPEWNYLNIPWSERAIHYLLVSSLTRKTVLPHKAKKPSFNKAVIRWDPCTGRDCLVKFSGYHTLAVRERRECNASLQPSERCDFFSKYGLRISTAESSFFLSQMLGSLSRGFRTVHWQPLEDSNSSRTCTFWRDISYTQRCVGLLVHLLWPNVGA